MLCAVCVGFGDVVTDVGSNNSGFYELSAVLTHQGRSSNSGHYVGWARRKGSECLTRNCCECLKNREMHRWAYDSFAKPKVVPANRTKNLLPALLDHLFFLPFLHVCTYGLVQIALYCAG